MVTGVLEDDRGGPDPAGNASAPTQPVSSDQLPSLETASVAKRDGEPPWLGLQHGGAFLCGQGASGARLWHQTLEYQEAIPDL